MQSLLSRTYYFFIGFTLSLITAGSSYAGTKLDVNIGIYAPFSKQNAFIGRTILGSLEIAREQLKSSSVHYSFYTLDQNIADKNATRTLQKFIKAHQIKVLVTEGVEPGRFVAPMAKKNNLIHFNLATNPELADGKNNFLAWSPGFEQDVKKIFDLKTKQDVALDTNTLIVMQQNIKNLLADSPVTELFHLLNQSISLSLKTKSHFSTSQIAEKIRVLTGEAKVKTAMSGEKQGVLHLKTGMRKLNSGTVLTA